MGTRNTSFGTSERTHRADIVIRLAASIKG